MTPSLLRMNPPSSSTDPSTIPITGPGYVCPDSHPWLVKPWIFPPGVEFSPDLAKRIRQSVPSAYPECGDQKLLRCKGRIQRQPRLPNRMAEIEFPITNLPRRSRNLLTHFVKSPLSLILTQGRCLAETTLHQRPFVAQTQILQPSCQWLP